MVGLALAAVGGLVYVGALTWFGRLPGDIRVERPGTRIYAPICGTVASTGPYFAPNGGAASAWDG